jgi:Beta-1,3-glucanase
VGIGEFVIVARVGGQVSGTDAHARKGGRCSRKEELLIQRQTASEWALRAALALGASAIVAVSMACSSSSSGGDDESGTPDSGTSGADGAAASPDSGTKPADAGHPDTGADTGAHPTDAGHDSDTGSGAGVPPDAGTTPPTGAATNLLITVTNSCPVEVWIHGAAQEGVLAPDNVHLVPGASQQYYGPNTWTAGRINANLEAPAANGGQQGQSDKVEMNFGVTNGSEWINTDITYVDWVALPSRIEAVGSGSDCTAVGCALPYDTILDGCPSALLSGHECTSAGSFCLDPNNASNAFCHALDSQVGACASEYSDCSGAAGATTADVYACAGTFFSGNPQYCASLNRGVLSQPGASTPASDFYASPPFNTYSAWVHQTCPGIYAFPYDDFGSSNQSSDHTCDGATHLNITWCPGG